MKKKNFPPPPNTFSLFLIIALPIHCPSYTLPFLYITLPIHCPSYTLPFLYIALPIHLNMAPPHISPKKTPTGPRTKSVVSRSLWASSVKKSGYSQSSQTSFGDNTQITEQFRLIRESADDVSNRNSDDEITRRRKSYTRENKLAAINYATTT